MNEPSIFDDPRIVPASSMLPPTPRDYQAEALDAMFGQWGEGSRGAMCRMPTGTGKTAVAAFASMRWLDGGSRRRVKVLCHERQLVQQWQRELERFTGLVVGVEMASAKVYRHSIPSITVASRQSLLPREVKIHDPNGVSEEEPDTEIVSRLDKFCPMRYDWLLIVDEAHRYAQKLTSCGHIFKHFDRNPNNRRLGLTATPERTDGTSLEALFPAVAIDFRMVGGERNAVDEGWAVPFKQHYVTVEGVDFRNLHVVGGDFDEGELGAVLSEQRNLAAMCAPMLEIVGDRQNLIFSATVDAADKVALWINSKAGRKIAESLNGGDKEHHRQRTYQRFEAGEIQHLSVCGLCREGYDNPNVGAVTIFRPTKSRSLAEQMKGRGCRPLRGIVDGLDTAAERLAAIAASSKPDCLIVDLVGVTGLEDVAGILDIYRDGEPDEVVAAAQRKLLDGETDPRKAMDEAEEEAKAARELLMAREAEKKRQREMDRRAKLEAEVDYHAIEVSQGHTLGVARTKSEVWAANESMRFGKHKGERIGNLDSGYLRWLVKKMPTSKIGRCAATELKTRQAPKPSKPATAPRQPEAVTIDDINQKLLEAMYER